MANLYRVKDKAMDEYYVIADDQLSAEVALKDWIEDPSNGMSTDDRLPVLSGSSLVASEDPGQSLAPGRVTLVFGPTS